MSLALANQTLPVPKGFKMKNGKLVRKKIKLLRPLRIMTSKGLDTHYNGYFGILPDGVFRYIFQIATEMLEHEREQCWGRRLYVMETPYDWCSLITSSEWGNRGINARGMGAYGGQGNPLAIAQVGDIIGVPEQDYGCGRRYGVLHHNEYYKVIKKTKSITTARRLGIDYWWETRPGAAERRIRLDEYLRKKTVNSKDFGATAVGGDGVNYISEFRQIKGWAEPDWEPKSHRTDASNKHWKKIWRESNIISKNHTKACDWKMAMWRVYPQGSRPSIRHPYGAVGEWVEDNSWVIRDSDLELYNASVGN